MSEKNRRINQTGDTELIENLNVPPSEWKKDVMLSLLQDGADATLFNVAGGTPMFYALINGNVDAVNTLKSYPFGEDVKRTKYDWTDFTLREIVGYIVSYGENGPEDMPKFLKEYSIGSLYQSQFKEWTKVYECAKIIQDHIKESAKSTSTLPTTSESIDTFFKELDASIENLDSFIKILSFREKKSDPLNKTAEEVIKDIEVLYRALERTVLFSNGPFDLHQVNITKVLMDIYKQLKGTCFEQFAQLLNLLRSLVKNYANAIKRNDEMKRRLESELAQIQTLREIGRAHV